MSAFIRDGRNGHKLVALAPALVVSLTAWFVLPEQAGGFRLAKWGAFFVALAVTGALLLARGRQLRLPRHGFVVLVFSFVASAVLLPALSGSPALAHAWTALSLLGGLALFVVTALSLDDDDAARRDNLAVLVATGASCSLLVLLQAAGLRWLTSDVYTGLEFRAPGTFGNPNWAAAFLAPLVPLSLGLAAIAERRWPYRAAAALLASATLATLSKAGAATLVTGVIVFVLSSPQVSLRRRTALLGAAATSVMLALAYAWQHSLFSQLSWLRGRMFLYRVALVLVGERPLTGWGLGGYLPGYGRAAAVVIDGDPDAFMPLASVDFAHNDLLQLAAECGLVTATMFMLVVASAMRLAQRRGDPLARAVGAAVVALFVNGLADSPLRVPSTFVLFFLLLGWLSLPARHTEARVGRVVLVAVVLLGTIEGARFFAGNAYWTLGRDALRKDQPAVTQLERARRLLPEHGRSASQYVRALARTGRIDDALEAASVAAALRFDFDDEILRRDLKARSLDHSASIALWQELSRAFPTLITPYLRLGVLHLKANERSAAITAYEKVLASSQPTARAEAAKKQARAALRMLSRPAGRRE